MKVIDFEMAIDALGVSGLVKDEVSLRGGQVTRMHGHLGNLLIMWDDFGRAFTYTTCMKLSTTEPTQYHRKVAMKVFKRDTGYDLKFG